MENFDIYFSTFHISLNFALRSVTFLVAVGDIHMEGTVNSSSKVHKKRSRSYTKNLRHISLHSNVFEYICEVSGLGRV